MFGQIDRLSSVRIHYTSNARQSRYDEAVEILEQVVLEVY